MKIPCAFSLFLLLSLQFLFAQLPQGDRTLAWQVDMPENMNYDTAFAIAQDACMESIHVFYQWGDLDTNGGQFDSQHMDAVMTPANIYYPIKGVQMEVQLATMNTNQLEIPDDLVGLPFNDPAVIQRFKITLDTLFARLPDVEFTALNIGNESNIYMGSDPVLYFQYKVFLDSVIPYAKQLYFNLHQQDLRIGTTFTLMEMIRPNQAPLCQYVNAGLDIVTTTYYPQNDSAFVPSVPAIRSHFDTLLAQYPDSTQAVYFAEVGYASSPYLGSSQQVQADFYRDLFTVWDQLQDRIPYLTIFKTTDYSQAAVDGFGAYYMINDTSFLEFLRTLGVRTWPGDGVDKLAYGQILCELNARNWCGTSCSPVVGVELGRKMEWRVVPQPVRSTFRVLGAEAVSEMVLYNGQGQEVGRWEESSRGNVRSLPAGVYYLLIRGTGEHWAVEKVWVE